MKFSRDEVVGYYFISFFEVMFLVFFIMFMVFFIGLIVVFWFVVKEFEGGKLCFEIRKVF